MEIKVFGTGCMKCQKTYAVIQQALDKKGVRAQLVKETDVAAIIAGGILSTPAVQIDGKTVWSGSVPDLQTVESWLSF